MKSLDKQGGGRGIEKSKVISINMPAANPVIKTDIDVELDNGWHIAGMFHDTIRDKLRIIFTKLKRN